MARLSPRHISVRPAPGTHKGNAVKIRRIHAHKDGLESPDLSLTLHLFKWHCPQGPHTTPCHYISGTTPPAVDGAVDTQAGWWVRRDVVARGWVGGRWALVGARRRAHRNMSGREETLPGDLLQEVLGARRQWRQVSFHKSTLP